MDGPDDGGEMLENPGVIDIILGKYPALESFGNAMTLRL